MCRRSPRWTPRCTRRRAGHGALRADGGDVSWSSGRVRLASYSRNDEHPLETFARAPSLCCCVN
jgi:hypothetical protein